MKTTNLYASAIVVAISMLALPSAQAASATATLTFVNIQLIDLNAGDGITPSLTFSDGIDGYVTIDNGATTQGYSGGAGTAGSVSVGGGALSASSAVTAGDYWLSPGPGATAFAAASGLNTISYGIGWVFGSNFTVSANTLIYLTATAQASASAALGETAYASAVLTLSSGGSYSVGQAYQNVYADGTHYEETGPLGVAASFVNLTNAPAAGFIGAYAQAEAHGVTSVPEPATYGLMSAGLLALGALARRRLPR